MALHRGAERHRISVKPLHDPFWATPVLRSTGLPEDFNEWSETKRDNYVAAVAFDTPPGGGPEVIEDVPQDAPLLD